MGADIGYNDGIQAFEDWFRKFAAYIDQYNSWVEEFRAWRALPVDVQQNVDPPAPPHAPRIKVEGPLYDPNNASTWPWVKNFFDNTMRKLKDSHDAANNPSNGGNPPDPTEPPPTPTYKEVAPKTANKQGGSDARFCVENQPGVVRQSDGTYKDAVARYDSNGLHLGGRSSAVTEDWTAGLVGARELDGRAPCELPRVGDPKSNTGSWAL